MTDNYNTHYVKNKKTLSIVVPVRNEMHYLRELLDEFYLIHENDVEIVISDNYSDDGTWEFLLNENNANIKLIRPRSSCSPFENWHNAISSSTGDYIYHIGGDDIFLSSPMKKILPLLRQKKNIIVIPEMKTFKDIDNEIIDTLNSNPEDKKYFFNDNYSSIRHLSYSNFDQLIFSFVPRENQSMYMSLIDPLCYEGFVMWLNFHNFYKININNVCFIDDTVLMKRKNRQHDSGDFNFEQYSGVKNLNRRKLIGTIKNSFSFARSHSDLKILIVLLFYQRRIVGSYGRINIYSPFVRMVLSGVLNLSRKYLNVKWVHPSKNG